MADGILAQLKVLLSADVSQLKSGLNEAQISTDKTSKQIEKSFHGLGQIIERLVGPLSETGRKIALGFDAVGGAASEASKQLGGVAGGLGVIAGIGAGGLITAGAGMFALAEKASEAGARIYDASEKTGIAASQMSGIAALAQETGGNFDDLTKSLSRFGVNLTNALIDPSTIGARELQQLLGGARGLAELGLKPMGDRLQFVLQKIFALNDAGQQHAMLQALLGRGWMDNIDTLELLASQGYGPAIDQARKFGLYFDDSAARQAKQFTEEWKTLKSELAGLAVTLGETLIPAFNKMMVTLVGIAATIENIGHGIKVALSAMTSPGEAVSGSFKNPEQEMTDFLTKVQSLTEGAGKGTGNIGDLASGRGGGGSKENRAAAYLKELHDQLVGLGQGDAAKGLQHLKDLGATQAQLSQGKNLLDAIQSLKDEKKFAEEFGKAQESMKKTLESLTIPQETDEQAKALAADLEKVNSALTKSGASAIGFKANLDGALKAAAANAAGVGNEPLGGFTPGFTPSGLGSMQFDMDKLGASAEKLGHTMSQSFTRMIEGGQNFHQMLGNLLTEFQAFLLKAILFKEIGTALSGMGGFLGVVGNFFTGLSAPGRALGGPVQAGSLYRVGEHGAEYFSPAVSGTIIPESKISQNQRPMVYAPVFNITTPNADSFRKSQSQILSDGYRQMALTHARNG